jgi:hypothetical protein
MRVPHLWRSFIAAKVGHFVFIAFYSFLLRPSNYRNLRKKNKPAPPGIYPIGAVTLAKEPVSRILSCAVIPLGAASPRTLISDLPGGFGTCLNRLSRIGPIRPAARFYRHWRVPPYLVLLRVGFTLPPALQPERCALTAPFHPYPGAKRASSLRAAELSCESPGNRGGIFSVALAVHEP